MEISALELTLPQEYEIKISENSPITRYYMGAGPYNDPFIDDFPTPEETLINSLWDKNLYRHCAKLAKQYGSELDWLKVALVNHKLRPKYSSVRANMNFPEEPCWWHDPADE